MMTFEEWFNSDSGFADEGYTLTIANLVAENCENRMDECDAKDWMEQAYEAGRKQGYKEAEEDFEEEELTRHINASFRGEV